jgi:transposase InsO family protein
VHDDLVERRFSATAPNLLWLTDITEHPTVEGKLYCCAIKDVFANRIVGYALGDRMTRHLAVQALRAAIARRQPHGTVIVHSDRDSFAPGTSAPCSKPRSCPARWAGSLPPATTPRWNLIEHQVRRCGSP